MVCVQNLARLCLKEETAAEEKVTAIQSGMAALSLVFDGKDQFDLVLTDIRLTDIDAFMLLHETVKRELPTILMSADEDAMVAKIVLENGACFFLEKPVGANVLKSLWQYVIKEKLFKVKIFENNDKLHETANLNGTKVHKSTKNNPEGNNETNSNYRKSNDGVKKKWRNGKGNNVDELVGECNKGNRKSSKKFGTEWTEELHNKFMAAVNHLGEGRCYPKEILELMNVPGLTRMQVASHLQKCRNDNWRAPETRKSTNASSAPTNVSQYKFASRKFGSMPRLVKSSNNPKMSRLQETWENHTMQLIHSHAHMVPNCVGANLVPHDSSTQSNVGQQRANGSNQVMHNSDYVNVASSDTGDENLSTLLEMTGPNQNSQSVLSYFGNATFGAESHNISSNQASIPDDFFDFVPEMEGSQGFTKLLGGFP
ncbi:two-component response regulator ARR14-like isoform X2 [Actinidia eriantha]|uniref:two-component response regulator ARR14-like isoform X2 n=1 Tax=Actinidia eriantha TaxID=165200 RepID=UPI0025894900|nr:two-component response regulator ARR14-like isoform X2 [Actinidia eriantha]